MGKGFKKLRWSRYLMWKELKLRLNILKNNAINSYKVQTAYFFENVAGLGSTLFYTLTQLLFIQILYGNVDTFAGYTKTEMLILVFIAQFNFYVDWLWNTNNLNFLINAIREGDLDIILSRPIPALFFVTFKEISIVNRIKDSLPNVILISLFIDWSQIHTNGIRIVTAIILFILGQLAWHGFRFLFALPTFFIGNARQIFQVSGALGDLKDIPFEGFPDKLKTAFTTVIPSLIAARLSTSVLLGKTQPLPALLLASTVAVIFLILKQVGWIIALRKYSSASS
ncbi:hypothetical protein GF360_01190 [candidate division WWE3 bacterium]|nr:hypothetical protein [candidate division WWE3 bacterium]